MTDLGVPALRILAPTFAAASTTIVSGYIASGLQDGMTNMISAFVRQSCPLIPCAWLLASIGGIGMVWYAFWISEICGILYSLWRIRDLFRRKVAILR